MGRLITAFLCLCSFSVQAQDGSTAVASFWQQCLPTLSAPPADGFYRVNSIGSSAKARDAITKLILAELKTGTFTSPWLFEGDRSLTPVVGGYWVLTDSTDMPRAVLRTTGVKTLPFDEVSEQETAVDGPALRELEVWRSVHISYFSRQLEARGKTFADDMPITMETFEVMCAGG